MLTKINWKVFITPVILTLVLSFGLSAFETLYSLYTADKVNYSPKDISIAITVAVYLGHFSKSISSINL
ncbi:quinolone resistance protein [Staphylococcus aureus]|nr:quinolone resistance protein [Staphylococcus aureus]